MTSTLAITRREMISYLCQPVGWVVLALFLVISGVVFSLEIFVPAEPAALRAFFSSSVWMLSFIAPALTMRLLAGEYRQGTIETLLTSPIADWQVILGKFLAALVMLAVLLTPTLIFVVLLQVWGNLDIGPVVVGYLGLLLLGSMYLALGTLTSTATQSLTAAYLGAFFFWLIVGFATTQGAAVLGAPWDELLYAASPRLHMSNFAKGVIALSDLVYFLGATLLFLLLAVKLLESRRWR